MRESSSIGPHRRSETRTAVGRGAVTDAVEGAVATDGTAADADRPTTAAERAATAAERAATAAEGAFLRANPRSFASSDVDLAVVDGRPESLTVRPTVTYAWAGLDRAPMEVGATLLAALPDEGGGFDPVATEVLPVDPPEVAADGRLTFASAHPVLATTPIAPVDFALLGRGEPARERTLRLRLLVDLLDGDGRPLVGGAVTGDWVVTVERDGGSAAFLDR